MARFIPPAISPREFSPPRSKLTSRRSHEMPVTQTAAVFLQTIRNCSNYNLRTRGSPERVSPSTVIAHTIASARSGDRLGPS